MDKVASKHLFRSTGISTPNCLIYRKTDTDRNLVEEIAGKFSMPVVVKAASQGSSIGVEIVEKKEDLQKAIDACFEYDDAILVEEFIKGRELSIPVYGNKEKKALPIIEITTNSGRYDYKSKYTSKRQSYRCITSRESLHKARTAEKSTSINHTHNA